ncbi:MAG: MFS transporter [Chromatiales bacterium]|nr:MFS transporter [Chromatiales bacterium]
MNAPTGAGAEAGDGGTDSREAVRLVVLVCAAQVLAQIGAFAWPALLPGRMAEWALGSAEAGWVTGLFYAAYTVSVPVLVTLTDRVDPRRVYLFGVATTTISHLGFTLLADGFASAAAMRILAGIGWAGSYMTGLKLLSDRVSPRLLSRATAGHAAGVGLSGALSFLIAGSVGAWLGWRAAFAVAAGCAAAAWLIAVLLVPPAGRPSATAGARLFDFRPVFRNRSAMAYAIAYGVHTLEMSALRGWVVAYLAGVAVLAGSGSGLGPASVAAAMGILGTLVSVAGNEMSIRLGRQRLIRIAMSGSMVCAVVIALVGTRGYWLAVALVLVYAALIWLDSSSLTAGAAGTAEPGRRGATLAVHSMLGYGGGFLGPVVVGVTLEAAGGPTPTGWAAAFLALAAVGLAGRLVFAVMRPAGLAGDRVGH